MTVDLTKLVLYSPNDAFKNNAVYTGSLTISGSTAGGTNTRTFDVTLSSAPDMTDIVFNGPSDASDPRPNDGWFKTGNSLGATPTGGYIYVPTNNAGGGNPSAWLLSSSIAGAVVTITATYVQTFSTVEVLTSTDFSYRVIDYSVF